MSTAWTGWHGSTRGLPVVVPAPQPFRWLRYGHPAYPPPGYGPEHHGGGGGEQGRHGGHRGMAAGYVAGEIMDAIGEVSRTMTTTGSVPLSSVVRTSGFGFPSSGRT